MWFGSIFPMPTCKNVTPSKTRGHIRLPIDSSLKPQEGAADRPVPHPQRHSPAHHLNTEIKKLGQS